VIARQRRTGLRLVLAADVALFLKEEKVKWLIKAATFF